MVEARRTGLPLDGVLAEVSPEEREIRVQLAAAFRLVAHFGWDDVIATHLTARVPGTRHFLINAFNLCFDEVCASNLVKIDSDGNPVMPTPYVVNRAGWVIHGAIHEGRDDAHAVIHLHTPCGQGVSAQACGLLPATQVAMFVTEDLAYHDYEGIAYDLGERERLLRDLGDKHHLILRNHGTLTVGEHIGDAFVRMYWLERACQAQVAAQAGGALHPVGRAAIERSAKAMVDGLVPLGRGLAWPALLRRVERIDPSYAD